MNTDDTLDFGPRQYAYELRQGIWCLGVFDNEHNGAVIGAANMRHHEVVFDRGSRRVGFFPSDCAEMHANRRSSILSGGYALNGCAKGTTSAAPAAAAEAASPPLPPPPSPPPSPPPPSLSLSPSPSPSPPPPPPPPLPVVEALASTPSPSPASHRRHPIQPPPSPSPLHRSHPNHPPHSPLHVISTPGTAPLIERHITSALDPRYAAIVEAQAAAATREATSTDKPANKDKHAGGAGHH